MNKLSFFSLFVASSCLGASGLNNGRLSDSSAINSNIALQSGTVSSPLYGPWRLAIAGDSNSADYNGANTWRWTSVFHSYPAYSSFEMEHTATAGWGLFDLIADYPTHVHPFRPAGGTNAALIAMIGVNDRSAYDVPTWCAGYSNYVWNATNDGFAVMGITIMPSYLDDIDGETTLSNRLAHNNYIRTCPMLTWCYDAAEQFPNHWDATVFEQGTNGPSGIGGIHLNTNGSSLFAAGVDRTLRLGRVGPRVAIAISQSGTNIVTSNPITGKTLMREDVTSGSSFLSSNLFLSGNLGIGTTDPSAKLEVHSETASTYPRVYAGHGYGSGWLYSGNGTANWIVGTETESGPGGTNFNFYSYDLGVVLSINKSTGLLRIGTNADLQIAGNGNIGIGAAPDANLGLYSVKNIDVDGVGSQIRCDGTNATAVYVPSGGIQSKTVMIGTYGGTNYQLSASSNGLTLAGSLIVNSNLVVNGASIVASNATLSGTVTATGGFVGPAHYDNQHFSRFTHCIGSISSFFESSVRYGTGEADGSIPPPETGGYGCVAITTGTSVGGGCGMYSYGGISLGNQTCITNRFRFRMPSVPTAANPFVMRYGYMTGGPTVATNTTEPANGVYFMAKTNGVGGTMYGLFCSKSSSLSSNLLTQTYYPLTWYEGRIAIDSLTNAYLSIGSNSYTTIETVTNLAVTVPTTTTLGFSWGMVNSGSGTTSYAMYLDYIEESVSFNAVQ